MSSGFKDKLYWRDPENVGRVHCFKKSSEQRWVALCGFGYVLRKTDGQAIERPPVHERCGECDGLEMARRGWTESGPATI